MLLEPAGWRRSAQLERSIGAPYLEALRAYAAGDPVRLTVPGHKGGAAAPAATGRPARRRARARPADADRRRRLRPAPTPLERALAAARRPGARAHLVPAARRDAGQPRRLPRAARRARAAGRRAAQRPRERRLRPDRCRAGAALARAGARPDAGVAHGVTPAALDAALTAAPGARAALVVAPTYPRRGARRRGARRGRALPRRRAGRRRGAGARICRSTRRCPGRDRPGADLVVSSTHKSLGSLSGSAMLHQGPEAERRLPAAAIDQRARPLRARRPRARWRWPSLDAARARAVEHGERAARRDAARRGRRPRPARGDAGRARARARAGRLARRRTASTRCA